MIFVLVNHWRAFRTLKYIYFLIRLQSCTFLRPNYYKPGISLQITLRTIAETNSEVTASFIIQIIFEKCLKTKKKKTIVLYSASGIELETNRIWPLHQPQYHVQITYTVISIQIYSNINITRRLRIRMVTLTA